VKFYLSKEKILSGFKRLRVTKYVLAITGLSYVWVFSTFYINSLNNIVFPFGWFKNYHAYYSPLTLATQAIMGLIVVLAIFYLGKLHDHRHNVIKSKAKLLEISYRFQKYFQDGKIDDVKLKETQQAVIDVETYEKNIPRLFTGVIILSLLMTGGFVVIMFSISAHQNDNNQKDFLKLIVMFCLAVANLLAFWLQTESIMSTHHNSLSEIYKIIAKFQSELD